MGDDDEDDDGSSDNDYKRWFRVVDGSGGRPPCSPPCRAHLPRRQGLPEEDRQSSSCLDCLGCLFFVMIKYCCVTFRVIIIAIFGRPWNLY